MKRQIKAVGLVPNSKVYQLAVQWIGPETIESKMLDISYVVKILGKRSQVYHVNMLKGEEYIEKLIFLILSEIEMF